MWRNLPPYQTANTSINSWNARDFMEVINILEMQYIRDL
jgi:hypothetical protein